MPTEEIWRYIPGYEGQYMASTLGRIKSVKKFPEVILRPGLSGINGYLHVRLDGKNKSVHRLVAETFIPNPHNKPQINHKNEIKTNNRVDNLEWATAKENINFGTSLSKRAKTQRETGCQLNNKGTSKAVLCLTTGMKFPSIREACRIYDLDASAVSKCCKGKVAHTKNLKWRYL